MIINNETSALRSHSSHFGDSIMREQANEMSPWSNDLSDPKWCTSDVNVGGRSRRFVAKKEL